MKLSRRKMALWVASTPVLAKLAWAAEPTFPSSPVRLIVPYDAGGGLDAVARLLARDLSDLWGNPAVVLNKPGADSIIGTAEVAKAKPDGYTLLAATATIVQNPHLRRQMPFDTLKDLVPVAHVSNGPLYLAVSKTLGVKTTAEFIELARSKPGKLTFGSFGNASISHLLLVALQSKANVDITHVPFKSTTAVLQSMSSGDIDCGMLVYSNVRSGLDSGKIVVLGSTGESRSPAMPDVPTLQESGLSGFERELWIGLFAPAKIPQPLLLKISEDVSAIVGKPAFANRMKELGFISAGGPQNKFEQTVREDYDYYGRLIKAANLRLE